MAALIFYLLLPLPMIGLLVWIALLLGEIFVTKFSEMILQGRSKRDV